jgi:hypothetical protein
MSDLNIKLDVACRMAVKAELPTILLEELLQHGAISSCATLRSSFNFRSRRPN